MRVDGSLWCWGGNEEGQLGLGDTRPRSTPTRVGTESSWTQVALGHAHTCAIRRDGSLWCWGSNARALLGTNDWTALRGSPASGRRVWDEARKIVATRRTFDVALARARLRGSPG
ncbi:MAG: RCC1 domain-containing protein [Myxococcota bacterium]|nr:RCC1 domain-containing protein [Myxococcota bacterium]